MVKTNPLFFGDGIRPTQPTHKKAIKRASHRTKLHRIILHIRNTHKGNTAYMHASIMRYSPNAPSPFDCLFIPTLPPKKAVSPKKRRFVFELVAYTSLRSSKCKATGVRCFAVYYWGNLPMPQTPLDAHFL